MKKLIFKDNDIKKSVAVVIAFIALAVKLLCSYTQYATVYPPLAPIDDNFMTLAAMSIVKGDWLGAYNYLTLSKHAFFAIWLAFVNITGVPYLVANMALWAAASGLMAVALRPALKKNWMVLFTFLGLLYNPAASAQYATRIYRDAIFPALCLMFVAGITAVGLRYRQKVTKWIGWLVLYGASFGLIYLSREDGIWIVPFFAAAFVIVSGLLIFEKQKGAVVKIIAMALPFAISFGIIAGYCYMNYTHYGRFIISDFSQGEFKTAYGAMTSLKQDNWNPLVAVPRDVREDLNREVELFRPLYKELETPWIKNGYYNMDEFGSGSFYWAVRHSLQNLGIYETPQTARDYYQQLATEIQQAVNEGRLETTNGKTTLRKSVTPPIRMEYVPDVLAETFVSLKTVLLFEQCDPVAHEAVGYPEEIARIENFIHQKSANVYTDGGDKLYFGTVRTVTHTFLRRFILIYKICIPFMFISSLCWQIKKLKEDLLNKTFDIESMLNIILLGLLGMSLLRCAMIAFVEVASFNIGTYVMYLSTVHPLLIAYSFTGFCKTFEN